MSCEFIDIMTLCKLRTIEFGVKHKRLTLRWHDVY